MLIYLIATALSCWLAWKGERADRKWPWRIASAIPLTLVAALRWGVGTDVGFLYLPQFTAVEWIHGGATPKLAEQLYRPLIDGGIRWPFVRSPLNAAQVFWRNFNVEEIGYRWLVLGIVHCGGGFQWFTAITSSLVGLLVFTAIWRQSRCPWQSVFLYVMTSNYFLSLNIVRQYVAIGLVLVSVTFVIQRRLFWFLLCVGVGMTFHRSALLALPIWFLPQVRIRLGWCFVLVGLAALLSAVIVPFVARLLPLIGLGIYTKYFTARVAKDGFEWIFFLINLSFMVMGAWYFLRAAKNSPYFNVWYLMTVFGTLALACSAVIPLMKRINYYFAAPQFLLLPEMLGAEENVRLRKWLTVLSLLAFLAETIVAVGFLNKNEPLPYRIVI